MRKTWLALDVSFLAWRAFYTTGDLSYKSVKTGIVYGLLRDVKNFTDWHATTDVVFCFDAKPYKRKEEYLPYKYRGQAVPVGRELAYKDMRRQLTRLREELLPEAGYRNILFEPGYEADDMIASVVAACPNDRIVVVANDKDLYQLLSKRVYVWDPVTRRPMTEEMFVKEYGVTPGQWPLVKAMAGCKGDGIPGIRGVGVKAAVEYVNGDLKPGVARGKIESAEGQELIKKFLRLVKLPYAGTPAFAPQQDEFSLKKWKKVIDSLGMRSLR